MVDSSSRRSGIETFLDHIDGLFAQKAEYFKVTDESERPHVWVAVYRDLPDTGDLTAVTYGLSSIDYRAWTLGRPELLISVKSPNPDWGLAAGHLVKRFRGVYPFSIGNILRFGGRITDESDLSAFFVFAPSVLASGEAAIELPDRKVNIVQLYPIYEDEIPLVEREGVGAFFGREDVDFSDVHRPNVGQTRQ
jgi:hypothetical protein